MHCLLGLVSFLLFFFFLFRDQVFRNQNQDFFFETKFSETETFFSRPNFPKLRLLSKTKFSETETETLKKLAKVSKPRSFETEKSISGPKPQFAKRTSICLIVLNHNLRIRTSIWKICNKNCSVLPILGVLMATWTRAGNITFECKLSIIFADSETALIPRARFILELNTLPLLQTNNVWMLSKNMVAAIRTKIKIFCAYTAEISRSGS